ncbi:alpha/beta-hydrolase [Patellaria atrata CBS 101060]|uniref:Alpha/beta-hydrolase n=1 Tax=Patellaria atrata CBS 101060 TaxID=1346257 RepID=A0A9P4VMH7_9PEZI|nr:alpha/beta-hydrolase [Patellaria atrata CBS 101060]
MHLHTILTWFSPTYSALFSPLLWSYRWRLLAFQPLALLINSLKYLPLLFSPRYTVLRIPVRNKHANTSRRFLAPLHLDIHGGGFLGGIAEMDFPFCSRLSDLTGTVVVSTEYRHAPAYPFPAAHEDVDDVVDWLFHNAGSELGADRGMFTVSGFSAGGNLALAVSQGRRCRRGERMKVKGSVTFYAPVDLRVPPEKKPVPPGYPKIDPLRFLLPLYDSYAGQGNPREVTDSRLHPILADVETLPRNMLFIIPTIDIPLHEQLTFVERMKADLHKKGVKETERKVESIIFEKGFHGWLEVPSFAIDEQTRTEAFNAAFQFIGEIHTRYS